jgi:hypothetical protein
MKIETAIQILEKHNNWRRGADIEQESPKLVGVAIDTVIKHFKNKLQ